MLALALARRWRWDAESTLPPSSSPGEHKDHTAAPPGPHFKKNQEQQASRGLSHTSAGLPATPCPFHHSCPQAQNSGKELLPRSDKQTPWSDPRACPLLGDSAADQAGHAWHWPPSLTPAVPHPRPHHHTGSHLLWQTASLKLLTPVILIQGVTGDPSLANRRKEPISLSTLPSPSPTGCPQLSAYQEGTQCLSWVWREDNRPTTAKHCERLLSRSSAQGTQHSLSQKTGRTTNFLCLRLALGIS